MNGITYLQTAPTKINSLSKTLRIDLTGDYFIAYNNVLGVSSGIIYDDPSNTFTFTFSDPTNGIDEGCLKVVKKTVLGDVLVNQSCVVSTAGSILTDLGIGRSGVYVATGYATIYGASDFVLAQLSEDFSEGYTDWGYDGLFMVLVVIGTLVLSQIWNPVVALAFFALGVVFTVFMGLFHLGYFALGTLIILVMITIFRLARRE